MKIELPKTSVASRPRRSRVAPSARTIAVALSAIAFVLGTTGRAAAQSTAGPYSNYNWNTYYGMPYYNPGYAQYGFPGVGVSPWNPIVQAQLNLGLKTARYNMYSSWADQSNAAANLYYQQAMAQAIQNQQAQQALQPRYDVRTRAPRPVPPAEPSTPKSLPKSEVLGSDGRVLWPAAAPSSETLDKSKAAAEAAIRVAVKEFEGGGKATIQSVAEAKSMLFAFGKPALEQLARANREEAKKLLKFFASLEQVLNSLAGEE
jgi:hypothetical protein